MNRKELQSGKGGGWAQQFCVTSLLRVVNLAMGAMEVCTRFKRTAVAPKEILILRTAALGDFVLSIPAMRRLRLAYPTAKITLLTTATTDRATFATVASYSKLGTPWLDLLPKGLIDEVLVFPFSGFGFKLIGESRRLLQKRTFDVCFILNEGIGLTLSGTAKKICFLRLIGVFSHIYGISIRAYPKLFPRIQQGARRLEHHVLAIERSIEESAEIRNMHVPPVEFGLNVPPEAVTWTGAKLDEFGCRPSSLILVAPGSRLEFKRWPTEAYVELITGLLETTPLTVILVGSGPEVETVNLVNSRCVAVLGKERRLHNLGGKTSIVQLAALLGHARVFVGNDGGTCHLAAAVGCRVVSISNGAEIPDSVEPWGSQRFTARHPVLCAPCYCFTHCPKNDNRCVSEITTKLVRGIIDSALRESNQPILAEQGLGHPSISQ